VQRRGYLFPSEALAPAPRAHRRLALRPFANLSSEAAQDFFATGLQLDLEAALARIGGLEVRADRASADVELSGSVRAAGGMIRVSARLTEVDGDRQLWSGRFDGPAGDIFALQDEITRNVAIALQIELTTGDHARLWDGQTASLAAWERYVTAYGHYLRWTEADNSRARALFRAALDIDPDYVAAKVMLAKTLWYDARFYTEGDARVLALAEAERLCREVLDRRPDAASAVMALGTTLWLRDDHDQALAHCRRACEMSPSDAWVLGCAGMVTVFSGDLDEAIRHLSRAAELSPQTFDWVDFQLAHARGWAGDDAGAMDRIHRYLRAEPREPFGRVMLALLHGLAGRPEEARQAVADALRLQPGLDLRQVGRSHRYRDPERMARFLAILRDAGLPD
jgi:TolB-like protein